MLSNSSLQTFGSWASKGLKTAAATLESAAVAGKAVVESTLQELVESDDEQNDNPRVAKQLIEEQPTVDSLPSAGASGSRKLTASSEIIYFNSSPHPQPVPHIAGGSSTLEETSDAVTAEAGPSSAVLEHDPPALPAAACVPATQSLIATKPLTGRPMGFAEEPGARSDGSASVTSVVHGIDEEAPVNRNIQSSATFSGEAISHSGIEDGQARSSASPPVLPEPEVAERGVGVPNGQVSADVEQLMATTARMSNQIVELESWVKTLQEDRDTLAGQCSALDAALWAKAEECKAVALAAETAAQSAATQREEAEKLQRAESAAQYETVRAELQRCRDLLVKKELELTQARDRVAEFENATATTLGITSHDLTRAEAQVAALQSSLQMAEEARSSVEAKFKQLLGVRRLLGDQAEVDEDFHRWVPRLEERLAQIVARGQALESANGKMTAELNTLHQANQQLQRQLEDATARANQRAPPAAWHQSAHGVGLDDSKMETVMALEARLAAKAQRLDALVTENHSLKMQLQNKTGASPFSHVQDEFQKTIVYSLLIRPVFRILTKLGGSRKIIKHGTEDSIKRWYTSLFASRPMQRIW